MQILTPSYASFFCLFLVALHSLSLRNLVELSPVKLDTHELSYPERLDHLKFFSLRRGRLWGDLIETFKFLRGFVAVDSIEAFSHLDF